MKEINGLRIKRETVHIPFSNKDWGVWNVMDTNGEIVVTCLRLKDAWDFIKSATETA